MKACGFERVRRDEPSLSMIRLSGDQPSDETLKLPPSVEGSLKRVIYLFSLGCVVYAISWSPILCRIIRGIVKYPDEMPVAVWVSTIGLLLFYELFIVAHCTSLYKRFRWVYASNTSNPAKHSTIYRAYRESVHDPNKVEEKWCYRLLFASSFSGWKEIVLFAFGATVDLISAILLSIEPIRENFGVPPGRFKSEPWLVTLFLLSTWATVALAVYLIKQQKGDAFMDEYSTLQIVGAYMCTGILLFIFWLYAIMKNIDSFGHTLSVTLTLGMATLLTATYVYFGTRATKYETEPKETNPPPNKEEEAGAVARLSKYHKRAAIFHLCLVLYVFFVGIFNTNDQDWGSDYLAMKRSVYLMTGDWKPVTDAKDAGNPNIPMVDDKYRIDYCATATPFLLYVVAIAIAWSTCSIVQHYFSACRLDQDVRALPSNFTTIVVVIVSSGLPLVHAGGFTTRTFVATLILLALLPVIFWVACSGVFSIYLPNKITPIDQPRIRYASMINDTRVFRWTEYTLSATLMHIVVLLTAGILSAHEVFLSASMLSVSMIFANLSDQAMYEAEQEVIMTDRSYSRKKSNITVAEMVNTEKAFIFLSFFAKGVLTLALTLPFLFADKGNYELVPAQCQSIDGV